MTQLRDARLKRALESAPDAELRPDPRVRAGIHAAAHRAARAQREPSVWAKWWNFTGSKSPVWNTAFAGIAVAALVTLVWRDREIPEAGPMADRPSQVREAPAAATAQPPATATAKPPAVPPAQPQVQLPAAPPAVNAPRTRAATPAAAPDEKPSGDAIASAARAKVEAPGAGGNAAGSVTAGVAENRAADQSPEARTQPLRDSNRSDAREEPPNALAKSAGPQAERQARLQAQAPTAAAPVLAAPPPAAFAPAARPPSVIPAIDDAWTSARIQIGAASVQLERAQADRLPGLLSQVARSGVTSRPPDGAPSHHIQLRGEAGALDLVDLHASQVRWVRVRGGERQSFVFAPDAGVLQALKVEADRLVAR